MAGNSAPGVATTPASVPSPNQDTKVWWAASTWDYVPAEVTNLSAQWMVPSNPVTNGASVFFFPSVQPTSGSSIVQPVLQWGRSAAGGDNSWAMADWYINSSGTFTSPIQKTTTGHTIWGGMSRVSGTTGRWSVSFTDQTTGIGIAISGTGNITSWRHAQGGVLEVHDATSCDQLPSSGQVTFTNIKLTTTSGTVTPQFTLYRANDAHSTPCNANATWTSSTTTVSWATPSDVPKTNEYYNDIIWLYNNGITTGVNSTTFAPNNLVTREQMAEFLYRVAGSPNYTPPATSPFTDVPTWSQYCKAIAWLRSRGITTVTTFNPTAETQRQQMAAFLYRFAGSPAYTPPAVSPFTDVATSNEFYKNIAWLHAKGVSTVTTFNPTVSIPRNQMAAMLHRMANAKLYCSVFPRPAGTGC